MSLVSAISFQWLREYILIIIIKSEVWTIFHCLGLGHETMVYGVCLSISLFMNIDLLPPLVYSLAYKNYVPIKKYFIQLNTELNSAVLKKRWCKVWMVIFLLMITYQFTAGGWNLWESSLVCRCGSSVLICNDILTPGILEEEPDGIRTHFSWNITNRLLTLKNWSIIYLTEALWCIYAPLNSVIIGSVNGWDVFCHHCVKTNGANRIKFVKFPWYQCWHMVVSRLGAAYVLHSFSSNSSLNLYLESKPSFRLSSGFHISLNLKGCHLERTWILLLMFLKIKMVAHDKLFFLNILE